MSKTETISIPKEEYDEFISYKRKMSAFKQKNKFNFEEVFGIGSGKLEAQEVKNMLREEW